MSDIKNDKDFRETLLSLDDEAQRKLGAAFVKPLLPLADDAHITRAVETVRSGASDEERAEALKSVKRVIAESYTRCGAEGDWNEQAGYFVARAVAACLAPKLQGSSAAPARQAAVNCRMARMCRSMETDDDMAGEETTRQHKILDDFLKERKRGQS